MTGHVHGGAASGLLSLAVCLGVAYELLAVSGAGRGRPWPAWRGAAFLGGCAVLAVAAAAPAMTFTGHMTRHLLVGMVAPLGLVLGAPVTLLLRSMPAAQARQVSRMLRTRPVRLLTHPVIALALTAGSLASLLLTPLYARLSAGPATHALMEWHFLLAGALFVWSVAGPDPAPHRPSVRYRLVVLGAAIAAHATLAQLVYAGVWDTIPASVADRQAGATVMYYGGDIAELVLAFAVLAARPVRAMRWPGGVTRRGMSPAYGRPHLWRT